MSIALPILIISTLFGTLWLFSWALIPSHREMHNPKLDDEVRRHEVKS